MSMELAALRAWATEDPAVTEDVACKGTSLESTAFKLGGKAFLFVQPKDGVSVVRLKLNRSLLEAKRRGFVPGAHGWVKVTIASAAPPAFLADWVKESRSAVSVGAPSRRVTAGVAARTGRGRRR